MNFFTVHGRHFTLTEQSLPFSVLGVFGTQHCYPIHGTGLVWIFPVHRIRWYLTFYNHLHFPPTSRPQEMLIQMKTKMATGTPGETGATAPGPVGEEPPILCGDVWLEGQWWHGCYVECVSGDVAAVWSVSMTVSEKRRRCALMFSIWCLTVYRNISYLTLTCFNGNGMSISICRCSYPIYMMVAGSKIQALWS